MYPLGNDLNLGKISGSHQSLKLTASERATHLYVCGSTGTGKSKFIENLIRQDIEQWRSSKCGMLLIDPHGSLYESVVKWMARHRLKRPVILIDLADPYNIVGYNVLRRRKIQEDEAVVIENFIQAMAFVWGEMGTDKTPLFARWADNILRTLYQAKMTLVEAEYLIDSDDAAVQGKLTKKLKARALIKDWNFSQKLNAKEYNKEISSTANRLRRFLATQKLRRMFGQQYRSLDMDKALEDGAIILVNTSTQGNVVGAEDASLFATLLLSDLWVSARSRGKSDKNKPFYVYLDEFQKFVTPTMAENLDEARGYGLHLTLAHQYPNQLLHSGQIGKAVFDSVMENTRSKVVFEVGTTNIEELAKALFMGTFDPDEIKHEMHSTKVLNYREEMRRSYSRSSTEAHGYGENERTAENFYKGITTESTSDSFGTTDFNSDSISDGYTDSPMLIPELGKELSHIQFRSLEEQLYRAMAVLFDQKQRQCVVRLRGMQAPASITTPTVNDSPISEKRVDSYILDAHARSGIVMSPRMADYQLRLRDTELLYMEESDGEDEPSTAKRIIKKKKPEQKDVDEEQDDE